MGSVQNDGQAEAEAAHAAGSDPVTGPAAAPSVDVPAPAAVPAADGAGSGSGSGSGEVPPGARPHPAPAPPYPMPPGSVPPYQPAPPYPVDAAPAGPAAAPPPPFPPPPYAVGPGPFPAAYPPPGWQAPPPVAPTYAGSATPYPPGPYPHTGPYPHAGPPPNTRADSHAGQYPPNGSYPAPSIRRSPAGVASWGAPAPVRTHRWGLGAYLLAEVVFLLVGGIFQVYVIFSDAQPSVGLLILGLAAPSLLAAGTGLLITRLRGNGPRIDLRLEWSWRDVGIGLAFGFGGLALTIPASMVYIAIVGQDASSAVGDALGGFRAGPLLAVLVLLIVVFITPMCEEILYRGLLWGGVERLSGRWMAFGVTTVVFALAHFELTRTPLLLIVAIPIALARLYTGKLLPAILAHQVNNLLPGIVLAMGLLGVLPTG